jgi:hypothetical protein
VRPSRRPSSSRMTVVRRRRRRCTGHGCCTRGRHDTTRRHGRVDTATSSPAARTRENGGRWRLCEAVTVDRSGCGRRETIARDRDGVREREREREREWERRKNSARITVTVDTSYGRNSCAHRSSVDRFACSSTWPFEQNPKTFVCVCVFAV